MNNEIKEKIPFNVKDVLEDINSNILWNYMTNLQQDNEMYAQLKDEYEEEIKDLQQENERLKEWKEDLLKENIELENIRKKAIEYIEEYQEVLKEHNGDWINYQDGFKPYLLNILQNGSDEE